MRIVNLLLTRFKGIETHDFFHVFIPLSLLLTRFKGIETGVILCPVPCPILVIDPI